MIRTLIADDEKRALGRLREMLSDFSRFEIIAEASDGNVALEKIITLKPDVAFLDIQMPGISVFNSIASLNDPPLIVFQTAYSKHAVEAFDVNAIDYLLKPYGKDRFCRTIEKITQRIDQPTLQSDDDHPRDQELGGRISVKEKGAIKLVPYDHIYRFSFEEGLCFVYAKEGKFVVDKYLNHYEEKLKAAGFFRTSRSDLINMDHITTIHAGFKGSHYVELADKSRVELSRRKSQALKKIISF